MSQEFFDFGFKAKMRDDNFIVSESNARALSMIGESAIEPIANALGNEPPDVQDRVIKSFEYKEIKPGHIITRLCQV